jgi:hypothetical protein
MPYRVRGSNVEVEHNGHWVVKYRHKNRADALRQMRALYANVPDARPKLPSSIMRAMGRRG